MVFKKIIYNWNKGRYCDKQYRLFSFIKGLRNYLFFIIISSKMLKLWDYYKIAIKMWLINLSVVYKYETEEIADFVPDAGSSEYETEKSVYFVVAAASRRLIFIILCK